MTTNIQSLQDAIEENTKAVSSLAKELEIHNIKQEAFESLVTKHDIALYGNNERKGLLQKFDVVEDKVLAAYSGFSKVGWLVGGVFLTAAAMWIWQTFISGLIP